MAVWHLVMKFPAGTTMVRFQAYVAQLVRIQDYRLHEKSFCSLRKTVQFVDARLLSVHVDAKRVLPSDWFPNSFVYMVTSTDRCDFQNVILLKLNRTQSCHAHDNPSYRLVFLSVLYILLTSNGKFLNYQCFLELSSNLIHGYRLG